MLAKKNLFFLEERWWCSKVKWCVHLEFRQFYPIELDITRALLSLLFASKHSLAPLIDQNHPILLLQFKMANKYMTTWIIINPILIILSDKYKIKGHERDY